MVERLLFIRAGAGSGENNTRSRSKTDTAGKSIINSPGRRLERPTAPGDCGQKVASHLKLRARPQLTATHTATAQLLYVTNKFYSSFKARAKSWSYIDIDNLNSDSLKTLEMGGGAAVACNSKVSTKNHSTAVRVGGAGGNRYRTVRHFSTPYLFCNVEKRNLYKNIFSYGGEKCLLP